MLPSVGFALFGTTRYDAKQFAARTLNKELAVWAPLRVTAKLAARDTTAFQLFG